MRYYVAMAEDSSLYVEEADDPYIVKHDIFGPYRTYQQASDVAENAEIELHLILVLCGYI
jgi:hypothetical protein